MSQVGNILQGHINEVFGNNDDLATTRLGVCRECALYKVSPAWGPMCDSSKYISKDGLETSSTKLPGYVKGCGCRLSAKTRLQNAKCIINKW